MPPHLFDRGDRAPLAIIAILPFLMALPAILGFAADPLLVTGEVALDRTAGLLSGVPAIDPNNGYTTQALGRRSALEWLSGNVPWWNSFSGVGLPLAAEYQPASLSPFTFLLLLPHGMAWHQALLQVTTGVGTYGLLRQLGLARLAATSGGLLFAFNGALAWFGHGPETAIAWVPWMLWGVERACLHAEAHAPGGWRLFALSLAMSLLAGFPETAYIGGLLALAWALVRGSSLDRTSRIGFAARIIPAGLVGLAITAPQTVAFFHYLAHAEIGDHADFSRSGYPWFGALPMLISPYYFGPPFSTGGFEWPTLWNLWGGLGGYTTAALIVAAAYGLACRPTRLTSMLAIWIVLALGKSFVLQPALFLWNLVPGVTLAAFSRYVPPTWELALVILAMMGVDAMASARIPSKWTSRLGLAALAALLAMALVMSMRLWPVFPANGTLRVWASFSLVAAFGVAIVAVMIFSRPSQGHARWLAGLLVLESVALYQVPVLTNPVQARLDTAAIEFLGANLGLNRFYTLGPIQPNYGAYFGLASINHNYLPVARRWTEFTRERLDAAADPVVFNGSFARNPGEPSAVDELRRNLDSFEWVGVKYVVAFTTHEQPFDSRTAAPRRVYSDALMTIYELPAPKPYFEVLSGRCTVQPIERTRLSIDCAEPSTLLRRELFFPGWRATVNGSDSPISEHGKLFQEIALPAGKSDIRFDYAPPYIGWAWLAAFLGLVTLIVPSVRRAGATKGS